MAAYNMKDRSDLKRASRERMEKLVMQASKMGARSSMLDAARGSLKMTNWSPNDDVMGAKVRVLTDKEQDFFAGMGSSEIGPGCATLAMYLDETLPNGKPLSILELGAGCGAPGLWVWKQRSEGDHVKMCLTDIPRLVPLLQLNCEANFGRDRVIAKPLRWAVPEDAAGFAAEQKYDLVIASDACYNKEKSYPLMKTIQTLCPSMGCIMTQTIPSDSETEGENAIQALRERAEEIGWGFSILNVVDSGDEPEALGKDKRERKQYAVAIVKLTPPEGGVDVATGKSKAPRKSQAEIEHSMAQFKSLDQLEQYERIMDLFEKSKVSKDGTIKFNQLCVFLKKIDPTFTEDEVRYLYNKFDSVGNGAIDMADFMNYVLGKHAGGRNGGNDEEDKE
jgi:hypothetical protein